jgi:hypothetical protein
VTHLDFEEHLERMCELEKVMKPSQGSRKRIPTEPEPEMENAQRRSEGVGGEREKGVGNARALTNERIIFILNFFLLLSPLLHFSHKIIFKDNKPYNKEYVGMYMKKMSS